MYTSNVFKGFVFIAMFTMLHTMLIGCNNNDKNPMPTASNLIGESTPSDSLSQPIDSENCPGIDRYYEKPELQSWVDLVESKGFDISCQFSFTLEDYVQLDDVPDSIYGSLTTLAFVNQDHSTAQYIEVCEIDSLWSVVYYELVFDESLAAGDAYQVTEGVWRKDLNAGIYASKGKEMHVIAQGDKIFDYLNCVRDRATAGCATGLILCGFSGPLYPKCAAGTCASAIIGAAILCLFI